jgi:hypothetical protein
MHIFIFASHMPPAFLQSASFFAFVTSAANAGPMNASASGVTWLSYRSGRRQSALPEPRLDSTHARIARQCASRRPSETREHGLCFQEHLTPYSRRNNCREWLACVLSRQHCAWQASVRLMPNRRCELNLARCPAQSLGFARSWRVSCHQTDEHDPSNVIQTTANVEQITSFEAWGILCIPELSETLSLKTATSASSRCARYSATMKAVPVTS